MTAHELANHLLTLPDLPVIMNAWGSDEGVDVEVIGAIALEVSHRDGPRQEIHLEHEKIEW